MSSSALKNVDFEKFGRLVLRRRYQRGLTQKELGEITGYTKSAVSKWEKGKPIHAPAYRKLCAALGISEESTANDSQNSKRLSPEKAATLDESAQLMGISCSSTEPQKSVVQPPEPKSDMFLDPDRFDELVARLAAQTAAIKQTIQANPEKREEYEKDLRALRTAISLMSTMTLNL